MPLHIENILIYDVPSIIAAGGAITAAHIGHRNKQQLKQVNDAVNGNDDPNTPTIKEQVKDVKDKVEAQ